MMKMNTTAKVAAENNAGKKAFSGMRTLESLSPQMCRQRLLEQFGEGKDGAQMKKRGFALHEPRNTCVLPQKGVKMLVVDMDFATGKVNRTLNGNSTYFMAQKFNAVQVKVGNETAFLDLEPYSGKCGPALTLGARGSAQKLASELSKYNGSRYYRLSMFEDERTLVVRKDGKDYAVRAVLKGDVYSAKTDSEKLAEHAEGAFREQSDAKLEPDKMKYDAPFLMEVSGKHFVVQGGYFMTKNPVKANATNLGSDVFVMADGKVERFGQDWMYLYMHNMLAPESPLNEMSRAVQML